MTSSPIRRWDRETALVAALAACTSIISFWICYHRGEILLYGDAVAHINIARRVIDSRTPGLLQLGTVWLPLPHLLMIPFIVSDKLWTTGIAGSIPSLISYVLAVVGVFRLVRSVLGIQATTNGRTRIAAWTAAVIFAANPNLIYLQTTALTEPLYLALFIWAAVYFCEFVQQGSQISLAKSGFCVAGACATRYDGWFLAVGLGAIACIVALKNTRSLTKSLTQLRAYVFLAAAVPILWIVYNTIVYKNPLEFANGPYSAKGIERRTSTPGAPPHPGTNNLHMAANYFLKSGELNLVEGNWHRLWLFLAILGTLTVVLFDRRLWPLIVLWIPLPFYMLSIAYSGVPIFIPPWWPYTIYNARYGIELLPAFAVFVALVIFWAAELFRTKKAIAFAMSASAVMVALGYMSVWRDGPISFREGWINSRTRIAIETKMSEHIAAFPPSSTILMYLGNHVGAVQRAKVPIRRFIYEGNHQTWVQPRDPDGLWERALANPEQFADFVIAAEGDAALEGVKQQHLTQIAVLEVEGQPRVTIYKVIRTP